ncbi:MAG TPA: hypothetical protein VFS30_06385 [Dehalococcoidia bacterium]|nr:hypothetical protein [Dehalococcoidia bacterium]
MSLQVRRCLVENLKVAFSQVLSFGFNVVQESDPALFSSRDWRVTFAWDKDYRSREHWQSKRDTPWFIEESQDRSGEQEKDEFHTTDAIKNVASCLVRQR